MAAGGVGGAGGRSGGSPGGRAGGSTGASKSKDSNASAKAGQTSKSAGPSNSTRASMMAETRANQQKADKAFADSLFSDKFSISAEATKSKNEDSGVGGLLGALGDWFGGDNAAASNSSAETQAQDFETMKTEIAASLRAQGRPSGPTDVINQMINP